ncbi:hypothetical protein EJ06DRAFT_357473 [Trichodelitschia bisporula]|uniref:Uncharacterized protein n=1 Tax=Trichodelitschia bisporula TaxID=703511 RepID=A0A6G1I176_9PEZI|nr:hypothetical protein EJ06DRAFT_357473 [Trichodelitschia bisporula]
MLSSTAASRGGRGGLAGNRSGVGARGAVGGGGDAAGVAVKAADLGADAVGGAARSSGGNRLGAADGRTDVAESRRLLADDRSQDARALADDRRDHGGCRRPDLRRSEGGEESNEGSGETHCEDWRLCGCCKEWVVGGLEVAGGPVKFCRGRMLVCFRVKVEEGGLCGLVLRSIEGSGRHLCLYNSGLCMAS